MQSYPNDSLQIHLFLGQASPSLALVIKTPTGWCEQTVGGSSTLGGPSTEVGQGLVSNTLAQCFPNFLHAASFWLCKITTHPHIPAHLNTVSE